MNRLEVPLMSPEATDAALNQLRTMTNHFNVVARALDSGFRAGWNSDVGQIRNDLSDLRRLIVGLRPEQP